MRRDGGDRRSIVNIIGVETIAVQNPAGKIASLKSAVLNYRLADGQSELPVLNNAAGLICEENRRVINSRREIGRGGIQTGRNVCLRVASKRSADRRNIQPCGRAGDTPVQR